MISKIQYISQSGTQGSHLENIKKALDAGCNWIQLRIKKQSLAKIYEEAVQVKSVIERYGARLIINDYVQVAKDVDADGVHLGLQDENIAIAKLIMGDNKIVGGTANTFKDVQQRYAEGVDYIGLGPFAFTETKKKLSPILGLEGYKEIIGLMRDQGIEIPVIAIGGVKEKDMLELMGLGVYGFAISGLLNEHPNPGSLFEKDKIGII